MASSEDAAKLLSGLHTDVPVKNGNGGLKIVVLIEQTKR